MERVVVFDFDDTLVVTTERFNYLRQSFCEYMQELGLYFPGLLEAVDRFDVERVKKAGYFAAHCFPGALGDAYKYCCRLKGIDADPVLLEEVVRMGWSVYYEKPQLIAGAELVLQELQKCFSLVLLTKGEELIQRRRVRESGLEKYFARIVVTGDKDAALFKRVVEESAGNVEEAWSVGNSIRSDINPALAAGMQAIHFTGGCTWHFEEEEPRGSYYKADTLEEAAAILLRNVRSISCGEKTRS